MTSGGRGEAVGAILGAPGKPRPGGLGQSVGY